MKTNILISGVSIDMFSIYSDMDYLFEIEDTDTKGQCFVEILQRLILSVWGDNITLNIILLNVTSITEEDFNLLLELRELFVIEKITLIVDDDYPIRDFLKDLDIVDYKIVNSPLDYIINNPI